MEEGEGGYSRWSAAELGMRLGIEFGGEEGQVKPCAQPTHYCPGWNAHSIIFNPDSRDLTTGSGSCCPQDLRSDKLVSSCQFPYCQPHVQYRVLTLFSVPSATSRHRQKLPQDYFLHAKSRVRRSNRRNLLSVHVLLWPNSMGPTFPTLQTLQTGRMLQSSYPWGSKSKNLRYVANQHFSLLLAFSGTNGVPWLVCL